MTLKELRAQASALKIPGRSKMDRVALERSIAHAQMREEVMEALPDLTVEGDCEINSVFTVNTVEDARQRKRSKAVRRARRARRAKRGY